MSDSNPGVRVAIRLCLVILVAVVYQAYKRGTLQKSLGKTNAPTTTAGGGVIAGINFPTLAKPLAFVGGGTRTKYGIAQIYAAGLYVDPKVLQKTKGVRSAVIADASSTKTIVLHFLRNVEAQKVQESLQQELSKRYSSEEGMQTFIDKLHQVLPADKVTTGSEITMTCSGKRLTFRVADKTAVLGNDKEACSNLWDVYIGKEAVSKDIRDGFEKGAKSILAA